jgi:hypothetical protein
MPADPLFLLPATPVVLYHLPAFLGLHHLKTSAYFPLENHVPTKKANDSIAPKIDTRIRSSSQKNIRGLQHV